jgi:uncharacterized protein with HEPN domain
MAKIPAAYADHILVLRHDYHQSQPIVLWETYRKDVPPLKAAVERIRLRVGRG